MRPIRATFLGEEILSVPEGGKLGRTQVIRTETYALPLSMLSMLFNTIRKRRCDGRDKTMSHEGIDAFMSKLYKNGKNDNKSKKK